MICRFQNGVSIVRGIIVLALDMRLTLGTLVSQLVFVYKSGLQEMFDFRSNWRWQSHTKYPLWIN